MDLGLRGKTAVVSGASQGIGKAVALSLAREGCHLALAARSEEGLRAVKREIENDANVRVTIYPADLSRSEEVDRLHAQCVEADILVNNAGAIPKGSLLDLDETAWRRGWELKVFGYINMTRRFYRSMQARRSGVILNIIGFSAERFDDNYIAGSSGNASLVGFTRALGSTSVDHGVRVVGVNPGFTDTDRAVHGFRVRAQREWGDAERWRELVRNELPSSAMIKVEEIADIVAFLCGDRAAAISGHVVTVDAGVAARSNPRTSQAVPDAPGLDRGVADD